MLRMLLVNGIGSENDSLWPKIISLAKKSRRKQVVVAYLGKGASKILPLQRGDVLVVDLSEQAVMNGQTDPHEVEKYIKRGVKVYRQPYLHAKLYVFDKTVMVSSANLSTRSLINLIEVGILSKNKKILVMAKKFINSLITGKKTVSQNELKHLKKLYRQPRIKNGQKVRNFWILAVEEVDLSEEEEKIFRELESKTMVDSSRFKPSYVHWPKSMCRWKEGDVVVQIYRSANGQTYVIPPSIVRGVEPRGSRVYCILEEPKGFRKIPWKLFKKVMKDAGLQNITENSNLKVTRPEIISAIYGLWAKH
jgi:hypothetical protein